MHQPFLAQYLHHKLRYIPSPPAPAQTGKETSTLGCGLWPESVLCHFRVTSSREAGGLDTGGGKDWILPTESQPGILFLRERLKIQILLLWDGHSRNIQKLNSEMECEYRNPSGNWAESHSPCFTPVINALQSWWTVSAPTALGDGHKQGNTFGLPFCSVAKNRFFSMCNLTLK